jgi:glutamate synthase (ferredoxin)
MGLNTMSGNNMQHSNSQESDLTPYLGQRWLVEERDACGVGFVASIAGDATHKLVQQSLKALSCMEHRGGCSADRDSGDGAGIMTAIPGNLIEDWAKERGILGLSHSHMAVGMFFLSQNPILAQQAREIAERVVKEEKFEVLGWREVPVKPEVLGVQAKENQPKIEQIVVNCRTLEVDTLERQLYLSSCRIVKETSQADFYICSFSSRTIVYKGMVRSEVLGEFYLDLQNPAYQSPFAVYHRRFSTNTLPKWPLAQPMRLMGHNGEINTLLGNFNWMMAREGDLDHPVWEGRIGDIRPIVNPENSDSATLDNVFELLVRSGRTPLEAVSILVPEAYRNQPELANYPEIVDYYEYYNGIQEAWDGPALLVFSDGKQVGASLDRNGLRPARYSITRDGLVVVASEAGVVDLPEADILEKGRLGPGEAIAVDFQTHEVLHNWEIKKRIAKKQPYGEWLRENRQELPFLPFPTATEMDTATRLQQQIAFGYTAEDVEMTIYEMAQEGKEPTFCMGDDIPLAVLSSKPHVLYDYFKQRFAQVTNPAIDPLREKLVMSPRIQLGKRGNLLLEKPEYAKLLKLESPVLNDAELEEITVSGFTTTKLSTQFPLNAGPNGLKDAVQDLCEQAASAVKAGSQILILSDRWRCTEGDRLSVDSASYLSAESTYIPPLLAVGAVHHYLIGQGLRCQASLVVDTAQCWSTHHFACLVGYGASAICPYLALETVRAWWGDAKTQSFMERGKISSITIEEAQSNYRKAVDAGLLKILSKMGISLLSSYQAAQIFEAIGIGRDLLDLGFKGTASRICGLSIAELAQETVSFHHKAFPEINIKKLENLGFVQFRPGGEYHGNSPELAKLLHKAVNKLKTPATTTSSNPDGYDHYETYLKFLEGRPVTALRDMLEFNSDRSPISIHEVEPVADIVKRFCTGGMSLGALSREAHENLAIAMNRLGGKSNSGEGGEDSVRFYPLQDVDGTGRSQLLPHLKGLQNGDTASSAIKQVAAGRFGVTPEYLMSAKQLEIKVSQGAKPGEGGQLPGKKVSPYIAMLRRTKPGVTLISPPPHHDIYSIEDLAQLIFDLHQINPKAQVSVKLVAEIGIGTVAAGVAKANADIIQVSGHDGGTGASPLSSIKHAGSPWELGLTEVHRVLMENNLRDRVLLRVDGGFKSGWDVIMGALMGGEEYGFGSIAMIAEGCIMARICHTNNCPVGVTSQREDLRLRYPGTPENVVNFFYFVAQEVRSLLAKLGYRSLEEIIGRADLLQVRKDLKLTKTEAINLDCLIKLPDTRSDRTWLQHETVHSNGVVLDDEILADPQIQAAIQHQSSVTRSLTVINTDRTIGGRIAGAIASQYGNSGFSGQINLNFTGSVGQSFGAFNLPNVSLYLEGEANDYVGKGMHGGEIVIKPPVKATYDPSQNVIIGNTCLYGATGGVLYANGLAGERFAVRNSQAKAVIEGAGDHCCEYMTGGTIVVLGKVGRNVGAGMTGGLGYFLDEEGGFAERVNPEIVKIQRVRSTVGEGQLKELISFHLQKTGSPKAKLILDNWSEYLPKFWQVVPPSEADSPEADLSVAKELTSI